MKPLFLAFSLFVSISSFAKIEGETRLILQSISSRYQALGNWKAKFTQHVYSVGLNKGVFSQGIFHFVGPDQFHYSLQGPEHSDFVSDGKQAWHFRYPTGRKNPPEVKIFSNAKNLDLARYLLFLRGLKGSLENIEQNFKVEGKKQADTLFLTLEPKGESDLSQLRLVFLNTIEAPSEIDITDLLGTTTKIKITSFEKITKPDMKLFHPEVPKNAKVQRL